MNKNKLLGKKQVKYNGNTNEGKKKEIFHL